jgi:hypothetical protein
VLSGDLDAVGVIVTCFVIPFVGNPIEIVDCDWIKPILGTHDSLRLFVLLAASHPWAGDTHIPRHADTTVGTCEASNLRDV